MKLGDDSTKIKRIVRKYAKQLYAHKLDNPEELYTFLETHILLQLTLE